MRIGPPSPELQTPRREGQQGRPAPRRPPRPGAPPRGGGGRAAQPAPPPVAPVEGQQGDQPAEERELPADLEGPEDVLPRRPEEEQQRGGAQGQGVAQPAAGVGEEAG